MDNKKMPKNAKDFHCMFCDFISCKKSNFDKHLLTPKHVARKKRYENDKNDTKKMPKNAEQEFVCNCGKTYKFCSGLSRHKKLCKGGKTSENEFTNEKEIIKMLIKENSELKSMILDVCKNIKPSINTNNINTNSHNKTFNLQIFLNETCKDAMNIMDFVDSIKLKLSDLENVGKIGYVDGISNIIVNNLKALDISKRPVHCSDLKREVLYVKDKDIWEKENEEKERLRSAIKHVAHKNVKMIPEWKTANPEYKSDESKQNDQYLKIISESMGGSDKKEDSIFQDKIIKNVAKTVVIEKENQII
jgi:hypothetical protein